MRPGSTSVQAALLAKAAELRAAGMLDAARIAEDKAHQRGVYAPGPSPRPVKHIGFFGAVGGGFLIASVVSIALSFSLTADTTEYASAMRGAIHIVIWILATWALGRDY